MIRAAHLRSQIEPNWNETPRKHDSRRKRAVPSAGGGPQRRGDMEPEEVCLLMLRWKRR